MTRARIRVRYRKNRALWEVDYRDAAGVDPGRELVRLTRVRRYRVRAERCAIDDPGPVDGSGGAHIACHPPGPAVSTRKQARNCALCLALEERAGVTSGRRRHARGGRRNVDQAHAILSAPGKGDSHGSRHTDGV